MENWGLLGSSIATRTTLNLTNYENRDLKRDGKTYCPLDIKQKDDLRLILIDTSADALQMELTSSCLSRFLLPHNHIWR